MSSFQGHALLIYNDEKFSAEDFKSIQRIGDSLKKSSESSGKIGRFGIGFNAVYHWTDLPSFVSGNHLVMLDPQARFLPNVNPSNPGKIVDFTTKNFNFEKFRDQFAPYEVGRNHSWEKPLDGTIFRLPLRTKEQADSSLLSKRHLSFDEAKALLEALKQEAASMLLFLKHIERIEILELRPDVPEPIGIFACGIDNLTTELRNKRRFVTDGRQLSAVLGNPRSSAHIDFNLNIQCQTGDGAVYSERWELCNQLGGKEASVIAVDPTNALLRLIPWGGVAVCVSNTRMPVAALNASAADGVAYCFLPLPVRTGLPVMVNGFFELSSNRRDVWQAGSDMTGDGRTRALWNISLMVRCSHYTLTRGYGNLPSLLVCLCVLERRVGSLLHAAASPCARDFGILRSLPAALAGMVGAIPVVQCGRSHACSLRGREAPLAKESFRLQVFSKYESVAYHEECSADAGRSLSSSNGSGGGASHGADLGRGAGGGLHRHSSRHFRSIQSLSDSGNSRICSQSSSIDGWERRFPIPSTLQGAVEVRPLRSESRTVPFRTRRTPHIANAQRLHWTRSNIRI